MHQPLDLPDKIVFEIEPGSNITRVNRQLFESNVLSHWRLMSVYARLLGRSAVQAGTYVVEAGDSPLSLLEKFNRGQVILFQITFPEGRTFSEWLLLLDGVEQFRGIAALDSGEIISRAGLEITDPEGWFFPDTYNYSRTDSAFQILAIAHQRMRSVLDQEWQNRDPELPYESDYQALIMASVVEKETGVAEERAQIAGVFVRRLQRGMRLQTDPTVIYGLGERFDGNLRKADLRQPGPYNTYLNSGLPPTPIAMPGRESIHAALHPAQGSSLYFVARGDGTHEFSDTLDDHQRAVQKFQVKNRVKQYRSSTRQ